MGRSWSGGPLGAAGAERHPEAGGGGHVLVFDYGGSLPVVNFDVRACRAGEASAILDLWERTRSGHASMPDRLDDVRRLLSRDAGSLLVADVDGAIVGALIAASDGWRGNMYRLAVDVGYRRAGIGLALVRAGEEYLRREGVNRVTALVAYDDDVAVAFWEAAGYPRDSEIGRRVRNL
jgi:ribosomal protein S18 acetylase RimI-like enzyme